MIGKEIIEGDVGRERFWAVEGHHSHTPEQMVEEISRLRSTLSKLVEAIGACERALKPFHARVYNDNGDHTISDTYKLQADDFSQAYFAFRKAKAAREEAIRSLTQHKQEKD